MALVIATGTRADWGLLRPLADELKGRSIPLEVWTTNMHSSADYGNSIEEIRKDGYNPITVGPWSSSPEELVADNIMTFSRKLRERKPKGIVILGDRMEMLGVATAAMLNGTPIIHIAGGTVSEGAVDNTIRDCISRMAALHLTETEATGERLRRIGIPDSDIKICGALGVYNAVNRKLLSREALEADLNMDLGDTLLVATLHAATIPEPGEEPLTAMLSFLSALDDWIRESEGNRVILTWPNNDVDPGPQIEAMEKFRERNRNKCKVVPSLGALRYLSLVKLSKGVVGNSSSGIVEVPSLRVPTLDIGSRQRGRERSESVIHCGPEMESIRAGINRLLSAEIQQMAAKVPNPYSKPNTPAVMADAILELEPFNNNDIL